MLNVVKKKYLNSTLSNKITILITFFGTFLPLIFVVSLSIGYYKIGIQSLFNEQIGKSISQTVEVAQRYLKEHKENIKSDALALAGDVEKNFYFIYEDPDLFRIFIDKQAELRNLSEIIIFHREKVLARNSLSFSFTFEKLSEAALQEVDNGQKVVILSDTPDSDKVRALVRLDDIMPIYLLVGRYVDQSILDYLHNTKGYAVIYNEMWEDLNLTQKKLASIFLIFLIVVCILSLWSGKKLAFFITQPLNRLVDATVKLKSGDFSYQIPYTDGKDETSVLTRAFNTMTLTLAKNQNDLIEFNRILDERRQFIEKIVTGVSAGVIALDSNGKIVLINDFAKSLLKYNNVDDYLYNVMPEMKDLLDISIFSTTENSAKQIRVIRDGLVKNLLIRIGLVKANDLIKHIIITVDDVTELLSAQRSSAWADVARRIAHEIKNPLTPISLAAERIKRKYSDQIVDDKVNFVRYIDTISRNILDIGKIVEDFVKFAKNPKPIMMSHNISKIINDAIFAQELVHPRIKFTFFDEFAGKCFVSCDETQISQVIINILKNSVESIEQRQNDQPNDLCFINVNLYDEGKEYIGVIVTDNGFGINYDVLDKIFEPYVTTKTKGTGLGLAIVKKIIEEHGGYIIIKPLDGGGVEVRFTIYKFS